MQVLSTKFEVIEENCTKPSSLLTVFVQPDQMWPLMWSSGIHFCLSRFSSQRSTFDGYFLNDKYVKRVKIQPWTTNGSQRRAKLICYMTSDCLQQYNNYIECLESEGENPAIFCCTGSLVRFEETIHRT